MTFLKDYFLVRRSLLSQHLSILDFLSGFMKNKICKTNYQYRWKLRATIDSNFVSSNNVSILRSGKWPGKYSGEAKEAIGPH